MSELIADHCLTCVILHGTRTKKNWMIWAGKSVGRVGAVSIQLMDSSHIGVSMPRSRMALLSNFPETIRGSRASEAGSFMRLFPKGRTTRYAGGRDGVSLGSSAWAFLSRTISDDTFVVDAMARARVDVQRARRSAALIPPRSFSSLRLLGFSIPPNLQIMKKRLVAGPARSAGRSLIGSCPSSLNNSRIET